MHLQQTVAFPQRDRNFSISALTQSTVENTDCCGKCESALRNHFLIPSVHSKLLKVCSAASMIVNSVTRLGDLLDSGEVFKAFGNN